MKGLVRAFANFEYPLAEPLQGARSPTVNDLSYKINFSWLNRNIVLLHIFPGADIESLSVINRQLSRQL